MQYLNRSYDSGVIANCDSPDSVRPVARVPRPFTGPLTFGKVVGEFVRRQRNARNWNQSDLKRETGISQSQLSAIETGNRPISAVHIDAILKAFNIEARDAFLLMAGLVPVLEGELRARTHDYKEGRGYKKNKAVSEKPLTTHPSK